MRGPDPSRQVEIGQYMAARLWVAEYKPNTDQWLMMKEPYPYSPGPFELLAIGRTLEESFDKAKENEHANDKSAA